MHRWWIAGLLTLLLSFGVIWAAEEDDRIRSENTAKSVRPALREAPKKAKAKEADKPAAAKPEEKADDKGEAIPADATDKIKAMEGKEAAIVGKVSAFRVSGSGKVGTISFGNIGRGAFTVAIFSRSFDKWEGGPEGIKKYEGKTIRVEGKVSLYQGNPQIIVNVPSQIKVLDEEEKK